MRRALRVGLWSGIVVVLLVVFAWYRHPDLVVTLATQIWNCF